MDFQLTEEQRRLKLEVQQFIRSVLPPDWIGYPSTTIYDGEVHAARGLEMFKDIARKLGEKGWLSMPWPKEYGGAACSKIDYLIFQEEMARYGVPGFNNVATKMLAPTLFVYGTEQQKLKFLQPIAEGKELWCEAFSEPEAGSDMAAIQTKAVKDGDYYVANGQKTWCTFVTYCDYCCLLARTDPNSKRHRGLSFFLVDLKTPGITIRPIENILNEPHFGEVFLEDVRIPAANLVGAENEGWKVAQTFLSYERVSIGPVGVLKKVINWMVEYSKTIPKAKRQIMEKALVNLAIEVEISELLCYQVAWLQDNNRATEWDSAMIRLFETRLIKRSASELLQLLGLYGQLTRNDKRAPLHGWLEHLCYTMIGSTLAGGTQEIQKTVVAVRGLGMKVD